MPNGRALIKPHEPRVDRSRAPRGLGTCVAFSRRDFRDVNGVLPALAGASLLHVQTSYGTAAQFNNLIDFSTSLSYLIGAPTAAFTFEIYLITGSTVTNQTFIGLNDASNGTNATWDRQIYLDGSGKFNFQIFDNTPSTELFVTSSASAVANTLYHVVVTCDGALVSLWINGALAATGAIAAPYTTFPTPFLCLGPQEQVTSTLVGFSGQFLLANYYPAVSLSASEVVARYADPFGFLTPNRRSRVAQLFSVSAQATTTPGGALLPKSTQKTLASVTTPPASLSRLLARSVQSTTTPASALVRSAGKLLSGSTTPTKTLAAAKTTALTAQAISTTATSLFRAIGKVAKGTTAPVGSLLRSIGMGLSGSTSVIATLITTKVKLQAAQASASAAASGKNAVGKLAQASSATVTSIIRAIGAVRQGSSSAAATLTKSSTRKLTGTASPIATQTALRVVLLAAQATATTTKSILHALTKAFAATTLPTSSLVRATGKSQAGSTGPAATALKTTGKGAQGISSLVATVTPRRLLSATLQAAGTVSASVAHLIGKSAKAACSPLARISRGLPLVIASSASAIASIVTGFVSAFTSPNEPSAKYTLRAARAGEWALKLRATEFKLRTAAQNRFRILWRR